DVGRAGFGDEDRVHGATLPTHCRPRLPCPRAVDNRSAAGLRRPVLAAVRIFDGGGENIGESGSGPPDPPRSGQATAKRTSRTRASVLRRTALANREHDGSEHAGTRAWDRGQEQDADRDPRTAAGPGEATADAQWFGDAPPPPPYAIDEGPPPPYAVGGLGAYGAERPDPQY